MSFLENLMYNISGLFLAPVLLIIVTLFFYVTFALGDFITQLVMRKKNYRYYLEGINNLGVTHINTRRQYAQKSVNIKGYDLFNFASSQTSYSEDTLSVFAIKNLENLRIVTRVAPMLGLVATMIPMGPALKSLANGNIQGITENLVVAFSAVIVGLIIASVSFWMAAVKKRWLADEMVALLTMSPAMNSSTRSEAR